MPKQKYCLVRFIEDGILYIVMSKSITPIEGGLLWAPYKRLGFYEAVALEYSDDRTALEIKLQDILKQEETSFLSETEKRSTSSKNDFNEFDTHQSYHDVSEISKGQEITNNADIEAINNGEDSPDITGFSDDSIADPNYDPLSDRKADSALTAIEMYASHPPVTDGDNRKSHPTVGNDESTANLNTGLTQEVDCVPTVPDLENTLLRKIQTYCPPENSTNLKINEISSSKSKVKKYFCVYCKKLFSKLVLHLERKHPVEPDVQKFSMLPKGCAERRNIIDVLRKKGTFEYNTEENYNTGDMIVCRRPMKNLVKNDRDYRTCPSCKGMYSKNSIRKHYPNCVPHWKKGDRFITVMSKRVRSDVHKNASSVLRDIVFPVLREDEVTRIIKYDQLVIAYGNSLCTKYRLPHLHKMIRSKLRLIGRFLIEIKKVNPQIIDFASVYHPNKFDNVIEAVNKTAKLNNLLQEYKSPATASDLGTTLKKCGKLLVTICIKKGDSTQKTLVEDFLKILEEDFSATINKTVMENQLQNKRNKQLKLPTVNDVSLFNEYLDSKCKKYYSDLLKHFDLVTWKELASYTLISIQTFNRRRAGELERATIEDYENHQTLVENDDPAFYQSLPEDYRVNAERYSRFEIRGKKARGVPVLLSKRLVAYVDLILKNREKAGVLPSNPYIFGIPGESYVHLHLTACDLMRKFAEDSGVRNHHLIRGTQLRKQLATQTSVLDLNENEVSDLANFLGHADKIHRDHYRMPVVSREIGRVSRLLEMGVQSTPLHDRSKHIEHSETVTSDQIFNTSEHNEYTPELPDHTSQQIETLSEQMDQTLGLESGYTFTSSHPIKDSWSELHSSTTIYGKKRCVSPIGHVKRRSWSTPEKESALHIFGSNIETGHLPSLPECQMAVKSYSVLENRSPAQLKAWVHNEIKKRSIKGDTSNKRAFWNSEEKEIMNREFKKYLDNGVLPSLVKCADVRNKYLSLQNRNSGAIKAWVNNTMRKRRFNK